MTLTPHTVSDRSLALTTMSKQGTGRVTANGDYGDIAQTYEEEKGTTQNATDVYSPGAHYPPMDTATAANYEANGYHENRT